MIRWCALAVLSLFAGALAFRLPELGVRPLHNDEAVNAFKVTDLWLQGRYTYDPDEYHGPTLHYLTVPFLRSSGARGLADLRDQTLRLGPAFFGAALILVLLLFRDAIGTRALLWGALFTALSPAMVFYSRYFIHEMLLVFFTALAMAAGWRYTRKPSAGWAISAGTAVGLMFATKETFVITVAAMTIAAAGTFCIQKPVSPQNALKLFPVRHLIMAFGAMGFVWLLFFSSFFSNPAGLLDSVRTYFPWLKRAAGHSPHIHPWYFYLQRLGWFHPAKGPIWSEGLILGLAVVGLLASFKKRSPFLVFLSLYTIVLTAAYSAISYKTPWCLLSFFYGIILLAGVGAAWLTETIRCRPAKWGVLAALLALSAQLAGQSFRASYTYSSDRRNPYVYAQTVPDILNLVQRVEGLGRLSHDGLGTIIKVMAPESDYWPLPWYLRRFKNIGFYAEVPAEPFAPIMIVATKLEAQLDEKSGRKWIMAGISELRPGRFFELYVEIELWKKYVATLPPQRD
jgi:uncharacterized protein (TIGR03663 family)